MDQLIINDLDFCQTELSELKGGFFRSSLPSWLALDAGLDVEVAAGPPYGSAYGSAFGAAFALGFRPDGSSAQTSVSPSVTLGKFPTLPEFNSEFRYPSFLF